MFRREAGISLFYSLRFIFAELARCGVRGTLRIWEVSRESSPAIVICLALFDLYLLTAV